MRRRPQVPRALLAWMIGLALALGTANQHGGAAEHGPEGLKGTFVAEAAGHPHQPAHMEPSQLRFHPGCAACLFGLQAIGVAPPLPAHLPAPALKSASLLAPFAVPPALARPCGSPRAPPAFPVSS